MKTLARNSLVQAALVAAVWVVASSFAGETATAKIETRHPGVVVEQAFDIVEQANPAARHTVGARKGDLLVKQQNCSTWPYVATECVNGMAALRPAARTITIEKRTSDTSSALIRVPAAHQIAAR